MRFRRTRERTVLNNIQRHDYRDSHEGCEDLSFLENQCNEGATRRTSSYQSLKPPRRGDQAKEN